MAEYIGCIALLKEHNKRCQNNFLVNQKCPGTAEGTEPPDCNGDNFLLQSAAYKPFSSQAPAELFFFPCQLLKTVSLARSPSLCLLSCSYRFLACSSTWELNGKEIEIRSALTLGPGRSSVQVRSGQEVGRRSSVHSCAWQGSACVPPCFTCRGVLQQERAGWLRSEQKSRRVLCPRMLRLPKTP